ncbi:PH domain-containing protein [Vallicoccus soli]|uniref:YdbS-like PH domain-containing protein n=1 Tax=Vallicoccus soli TaxID=2339232 RepID=A0A3A3Z0W0_9ACTN|nr:PH domain-containing protein [Vallicoccus soli]RJK96046.1 hypothetical protein D5H78_10840 [Vallicoccus soli]
MDELFEPGGGEWTGVSERLAALERLVDALWVLGVGAVVGVVLVLTDQRAWLPAVGAVAAVLLAWGWWYAGRSRRAWGYTEREQDLLVRRGVAWRSLVVVPYGRMQFVDVTRGPLERAFGIATVQLHTAAAATDARIPGLLPEEASRLRDRLAHLGETRTAGL